MSSERDKGTSDIGGKVFICSFAGCSKSYRRGDRLKHHVAACHERKNPFFCTHRGCDKSYSNPSGLKRHVNKVHSEKTTTTSAISCTVENCDATFTCKTNLKKHLKRIHEGRQFKCSHCVKCFVKRQHLKIHEFQHTGVKPFKCLVEGCGKDFLLPSKLKVHMKCHQGYKCSADGCDLMFASWSLRQKHIKEDHVVDHKCSVCDKSFSNKKNLRNHMATHSETRKVFKCPLEDCKSFYYYEINLKQHIQTKHEGNKYGCTHQGCDVQFKHKCSLAKHLKVHESLNPLEDKPKPERKSVRRRSTTARLARYKATSKEEMAVMYPEKCCPKEEMPKVLVISSDQEQTTDLEQNNEPNTQGIYANVAMNDHNVKERDENLINVNNDDHMNEIQGIVCNVAA